MNTLEKIMLEGIQIAQEHGLNTLPEKEQIPFSEEVIEDFIDRQIEDLFEFSTLEQFEYKNMFTRAFMYTYGKGGEFALSHRLGKPMERIGYNFHDCMKGKIATTIPDNLRFNLNKNSSTMLQMYDNMYEATKVGTEQLLKEGLNYGNCIFKILSGGFFWGRKIMLSFDIDKKVEIDFDASQKDKKYDYDNYNNDYSESDYQTVNYRIGNFDEIRHLFDKK